VACRGSAKMAAAAVLAAAAVVAEAEWPAGSVVAAEQEGALASR